MSIFEEYGAFKMKTGFDIQNRLLCFCDALANTYVTLIYLHQKTDVSRRWI